MVISRQFLSPYCPNYSIKTKNSTKFNKLYSGKYLVTSLRHSIKDDRHSMIMEVVKDSYFSSLPKGK